MPVAAIPNLVGLRQRVDHQLEIFPVGDNPTPAATREVRCPVLGHVAGFHVVEATLQKIGAVFSRSRAGNVSAAGSNHGS